MLFRPTIEWKLEDQKETHRQVREIRCQIERQIQELLTEQKV